MATIYAIESDFESLDAMYAEFKSYVRGACEVALDAVDHATSVAWGTPSPTPLPSRQWP